MTQFLQMIVPINIENKLQLYATFFKSLNSEIPYRGTILYFHGGGLIFGERDDLPKEYISLLTEAGYGILALDYLLAPESKIDQITQSSQNSVEWFINHGVKQLDLPHRNYYLMGRSAGGYLAIYNAVHASLPPKGLISFYGYYNLNEASFNVPSRHFLKYPKVTPQTVEKLMSPQPIVSASMDERFPIYISARQTGRWNQFILTDNQSASDFSLTKQQLSELPPTFIAAATEDPDVPVRQSKLLNKFAKQSDLHLIESDEHDFDRTQIFELGIPLYKLLIDWLNLLYQS